mmetsp:Transcript_15270/g.27819  ORF Transcript_15270/g.27819 Transcript_15270/m.27819 type:complete len:120 (+) Transcript_15270:176-535(+)
MADKLTTGGSAQPEVLRIRNGASLVSEMALTAYCSGHNLAHHPVTTSQVIGAPAGPSLITSRRSGSSGHFWCGRGRNETGPLSLSVGNTPTFLATRGPLPKLNEGALQLRRLYFIFTSP